MYYAFLQLVQILKEEMWTKEGNKVAMKSFFMVVTEGVCIAKWDPKHKHQDQRHRSAPCFFTRQG